MTKFFLKTAFLLLVVFASGCSSPWHRTRCEDVARTNTEALHAASPVAESDNRPVEPAKAVSTQTSRGTRDSSVRPDSLQGTEAGAPFNPQSRQETSKVGLSPPEQEKLKRTQQVLDEALEFCQASQDFWGQGDFENAIASLDHAYSLILQADTVENSKLVQQKEDIRFMICRRMLEIYSSQHTVANGNHDAIPMVMNQYVQKEIKRFSGPERKSFVDGFTRAGRYRPEILKALQEAGLPKELSWLPLIESGFKVNALSRARALGLWQFIPSTGYKFGLKRDQWIDERMDVGKSTQAAIAYLQELHSIFGDWCTVLAGYNCGEARVLRVIRNQNINYLDNFWDLYEKLPPETARYVPRFLAALHILDAPERFGFDLSTIDPPLTYDLVTASSQLRLKDIAQTLGIPLQSLEMLNPELRYKVTPPGSYGLRVPKGQGSALVAKLADIPAYALPRKGYAYHRVRPGQTLSYLASHYGTSIRAIMQANGLSRQDYVRVDQTLRIPVEGSGLVYAKESETGVVQASTPARYRVKRGDSMWLLARRYNTDIQEILRLNDLKSTRLHIGQELLIREGTRATEPLTGANTYQVKRGDSPYQIAIEHQMTLEQFLSVNDLSPGSKIFPGQVFLVDTQ